MAIFCIAKVGIEKSNTTIEMLNCLKCVIKDFMNCLCYLCEKLKYYAHHERTSPRSTEKCGRS
jgi:hypothetical protein